LPFTDGNGKFRWSASEEACGGVGADSGDGGRKEVEGCGDENHPTPGTLQTGINGMLRTCSLSAFFEKRESAPG
jgi:hypothetical protein